MHTFQFEILKPTEASAFEDMCANVYRTVFSDPLPQRNGSSGQRQGGVDIFVKGPSGRVGIQCKRVVDGGLNLRIVQKEVAAADKAAAPIVHLVFATTAKSDSKLISEVHSLSDRRVAEAKFSVQIDFWQDICLHINRHSSLQVDYAPNAPGAVFSRVEASQDKLTSLVLDIQAKLPAPFALPTARPDAVANFFTKQLDAINETLRAARFQDASEALKRLGTDLALLDSHQQARWYVQRGVCAWHLQSTQAAAPDFLKAAEIYPDDEKFVAARIRALLFLDQIEEAVEAGQAAVARFPSSANVWAALANARMLKGQSPTLADAPADIKSDPIVWQLIAWSRKRAGDLDGAAEASATALSLGSNDFFVRDTALVLSLEVAARDPVNLAFGLVNEVALERLRLAAASFEPRRERLWSAQAGQAMEDVAAHLTYAYQVLGKPAESLVVLDEAKHAGVASPRLNRATLEAHRRLGDTEEIVRLSRGWVAELEEDALTMVSECAAKVGDVELIEAAQARATTLGDCAPLTLELLQAIKWGAQWHADVNKQQALDEVRAAGLATSNSLALICGGARLLNAAGDQEAVDTAIAQGLNLIDVKAETSARLMLADLLFDTERFAQAAAQYETMALPGRHSELHNRLLRCYIRANAFGRAKALLESFPPTWTEDDRTLSLALDLGQKAADWEFLVPLARLHTERKPTDAGGWLWRLALDLKLRRMARFHEALASVPPELKGSPRSLAQVASFELRYDRREAGMRRLYRLLRSSLDDVKAASAFFMAIAVRSGPAPYLEKYAPNTESGIAVELEDETGKKSTVVVDPDGVGAFVARDEFVDPTNAAAPVLLAATPGGQLHLPAGFGTQRTFKVLGISTAYLHLLRHAQRLVHSPLASDAPLLSVPVPRTPDGADFSHVHAMLKEQAEHSRRSLQLYADTPATLGMLARLLGRSIVDIVCGWPGTEPHLFVCLGTEPERREAFRLLARPDAEYVVDAATIAELALLDKLEVLSQLPKVLISTKSVEVLEARLEEAKLDRESGKMYDDNGTMRVVLSAAPQRRQRKQAVQAMVVAARKYCVVLPAYGPMNSTEDLSRASSMLEDEELSALLLAAEKGATLFTVDGRFADIAKLAAGMPRVWPQAVLMHLHGRGRLALDDYSAAVGQLFLLNRSFVAIGPYDLVELCRRGGGPMREGLQRFKDYVASPLADPESANRVVFEFMELVTHQSIRLRAFLEILEHMAEAMRRHPKCDVDALERQLISFIQDVSQRCNHSTVAYPPVQEVQLLRARTSMSFMVEFAKIGLAAANDPAHRRAIKLRWLQCTTEPTLWHSEDIVDRGESVIKSNGPATASTSVQPAMTAQVESSNSA